MNMSDQKLDSLDIQLVKELIPTTLSLIKQRSAGIISGVSTGFKDLDEMIGKLENSSLIVIASRPSMGKTALALNIAAHVAIRQNASVAYFTFDASSHSLIERLICSEAGVNCHLFRHGLLSEIECNKIPPAINQLTNCSFYLDDTLRSVPQIVEVVNSLKSRDSLDLLIIDPVQGLRLETGTRPLSKQMNLTSIIQTLKTLAKNLDIPIVLLTDLSRQVDRRDDGYPQLIDLRESGIMEHLVDMVFFVYREEVYLEKGEPGKADIIIAKNKYGPIGSVVLAFNRECTRFTDYV